MSTLEAHTRFSWRDRGEWFALAFILTVASSAVPSWWLVRDLWNNYCSSYISYTMFYDFIFLIFGLILVLPTHRRSGLHMGRIREHWKMVLVVCGLPVLVTAIVYPQLSERPFGNNHYTIWLISPWAQEILFSGFLYGRFEELYPSYIHDRIRIRRAVPITACFFALWHTPGFASNISTAYMLFQLCYTFIGFVIGGLARQWTGSIYYGVLSHMAVNFIAWQTSWQ